ncbi:GH92 family glycosyl hydrolase [Clostridium tertium]
MRIKGKKLLATLLAMTLAVTTIKYSSVFAKDLTTNANTKPEKQILFETSFEENETDKEFLVSTIDEKKGSNNVSGISKEVVIDGSINDKIILSSIKSSTRHNDNEIAENLFDDSTNTKFLANNTNGINSTNPVWVSFEVKDKVLVDRYQIVAANDAQERDPKTWKLLGSNDGERWEVLDSQINQSFSTRFERKEYRINNAVEYKYFKLEITEVYKSSGNNMAQWSELNLGTGIKEDVETVNKMTTAITKGPSGTWNQASGKGWTGTKAVEVAGVHEGNERAYSYNVIYKDLDIKVSEDTSLSYTIFPSMIDERDYDYDYTQMHIAVDVEFSDGSFLSDLNAIDQYDTKLNPQAQGDSKILTTNQWNYISSNIGSVANGKIIKNILIAYDNKDNPKEDNAKFITYIDDLKIYNEESITFTHKSDYVNILRGTNDSPSFSRGLTAPAVTMPHGFNFFVPATNSNDNKIYNYQLEGNTLKHITISHEPSYWVGDRGTWQFMINTSIDATKVTNGDKINASARQAEFTHENETAKAHYYSVKFNEGSNASNSKIEVTPTEHGAVSRFTFDKDSQNRNIIFDSTRADGTLKFNDDGTFEASSNHNSNGMQTMYIYGEFSEEPYYTSTQNTKQGIVSFNSEVVEMNLATSFISIEQAKKNLELEITNNDDFDSIFTKAQNTWDDTLDMIEVKGASKDQLTTLYSNLYRLNAYPNLLSENTGTNDNPNWKYRSPYGDHEVVEGTLYYNNGFWDTYRTAWAAYALFTPEKDTELLNGLVQHYLDQGYVPRWIAPGGTNSMVGTSSDVIFGDAIAKGIEFDWESAYESAIKNAAVAVDSENLTNGGRAKLNKSIFEGYTAHNLQHEGFSWSIEGYINDYGIYQLAKKLGNEDEAEYYLNRALNYSKLFSSIGDSVNDKWLRGKDENGEWSYSDNEFNPFFWGDDYTETNAFNMAVSVPQDVQGLANLYGGRAALAEKIDTIFETNGDYWGYGATESIGGIHEQKEAREIKLGQYGHSNQPSHHIPYMYNYAGEPWKTQKYVRDILDRAYVGSDFGQGYIGDEDNGEMSAWYIFSALGFYPVSMGNDEYAIGSPLFEEMTVHLDNGKSITVKANNNSNENIYIQSMKLNGEDYTKNYLKHSDIANGATIEFTMGSTPNKNWGSSEDSLPTSITKNDDIPNPLEDLTIKSVQEIEKPSQNVHSDSIHSNIEDVTKLFDNDSNTFVTLNNSGNSEIIYDFTKPSKVSMITLTSAKDGDAPIAYKLSGSYDGEEWELIDERSNLEFEWGRYTRPFKLQEEKTSAFIKYKLELVGGTALSEVELLGQEGDTSGIDINVLNKLIISAKTIDQSNLIQVIKDLLNNAIKNAEAVANNENSTHDEIVNQYNELSSAIRRINSIKIAKDRLEAEDFSSSHSSIVNDGNNIGGVKKDTWARYNDIAFDGNENSIEFYYSAQQKDAGGYIEVHIDSIDSEVFAKIDVPVTGADWSTYVLKEGDLLKNIEAGLHDVYLVFKNETDKAYVSNVDYFRFGNKIDVDITQIGEGNIIKENGYEGRPYTITFDGDVRYVFINGVSVDFNKINKLYTLDKLTSDTKIVVVFGELVAHKIITEVQGGEADVELSKNEATGYEEVILTIKNIKEGKILSSVRFNGEEVKVSNAVDGVYTIKLIMPFEDSKIDIILEDKIEMVNIKVNQPEHGLITTTAIDDQIIKGKDLTINIIQENGYKIESLVINGKDVTSLIEDNTLVYKSVLEDLEISATFVIDSDKESIIQLITSANEVIEKGLLEGVNQSIVDEFNNALENAVKVNEDKNSTQQVIDEAVNTLRVAIKNVIDFEKVNKSELQDYVREVENLDLIQYTSASAIEFKEALDNAINILNNEAATQNEVDEALSKLKLAKNSLKLIPNKKSLEVLIIEIEKMDFSKYTEESVKELKAAIQVAKVVLENINTDEIEVESAIRLLEEAKGKLAKIEDLNMNPGSTPETENPGENNSEKDNSNEENKGSLLPSTGDDSSLKQYIYIMISLSVGLYLVLKKRK